MQVYRAQEAEPGSQLLSRPQTRYYTGVLETLVPQEIRCRHYVGLGLGLSATLAVLAFVAFLEAPAQPVAHFSGVPVISSGVRAAIPGVSTHTRQNVPQRRNSYPARLTGKQRSTELHSQSSLSVSNHKKQNVPPAQVYTNVMDPVLEEDFDAAPSSSTTQSGLGFAGLLGGLTLFGFLPLYLVWNKERIETEKNQLRYAVSMGPDPHKERHFDVEVGTDTAKPRSTDRKPKDMPRPPRRAMMAMEGKSILPAGRRRIKLELPTSVLFLDGADKSNADLITDMNAGIKVGANCIVLEAPPQNLYNTALAVHEALNSRCPLLINDRSDIAGATGVEGLLLGATSMPTGTARRTMLEGSTSIMMKIATTSEDAVSESKGGANAILFEADSIDGLVSLVKATRPQIAIPILAKCPKGVFLSMDDVKVLTEAGLDGLISPPSTIAQYSFMLAESFKKPEQVVTAPPTEKVNSTLLGFDKAYEKLQERVQSLMDNVVSFLREKTPQIREISLLEDAVQGLSDPFLVVVVGEFNSGKSSMINALLGDSLLPEGILPTTNEICMIQYVEPGDPLAGTVQQQNDGLYVRYLSSDLLKDISIVDTPGTNVVLERQQTLTEEFVPRADMVLFVTSVDRPFTASESKFLQYIQTWGKKLVFVLNKCDRIAPNDVITVKKFVASNANELLGISSAKVIPVSAKMALDVKIQAGGTPGVENYAWIQSGYAELETYMAKFLSSGIKLESGEPSRAQLKLDNPLFTSLSLIQAAQRDLEAESERLANEVATITTVPEKVNAFYLDMEKDAKLQRAAVGKVVRDVAAEAEAYVDEVLQLSNWSELVDNQAASAFKLAKEFQGRVAGNDRQIESLVKEHTAWLAKNNSAQLEAYEPFFQRMEAEFGKSGVPAVVADVGDAEAESADVLEASAQLLETEIRDVAKSVKDSAIVGPLLGLVSTIFLPDGFGDTLGLALGFAVAYPVLLNIPLKRNEIKEKIRKVATKYTDKIEGDMERLFETSTGAAKKSIHARVDALTQRGTQMLESAIADEEQAKNLEALVDAVRQDIRTFEA